MIERLAYTLPLVGPLKLGMHAVRERRGWLLRRGTNVADVCPLPGFSWEALDEVEAAFESEEEPPASLEWARHALELSGESTVRTVGLVLPDGVPAPGFSCVKVKVGRRELDQELELVAGLRDRGVRLRLDGNRTLTLEAAKRLADAAGDALEFLEEPTAAALLERSAQEFPVAIDESLMHLEEVPPGVAAIVLKPTILGTARTHHFLRIAGERALPVVISSAFESAVGRADLVRFAARVAPDVAHGLGTGPAFAEDFSGWLRSEGESLTSGTGELPEGEWVAC